MREQPVLRTSRLVLRPFRPTDAATVRQLAGVWEVANTTLTIPHPYPDGAAEVWIATHAQAWDSGASAVYAITNAETDELLGAVGLTIVPDHARAELGYWIGAPYWNRGYCTEACGAMLTLAFGQLRLHRVQARHFVRNPASGRVMQKLGMRLEGLHRGAYRRWDQFEDVAHYAILDSEWQGMAV